MCEVKTANSCLASPWRQGSSMTIYNSQTGMTCIHDPSSATHKTLLTQKAKHKRKNPNKENLCNMHDLLRQPAMYRRHHTTKRDLSTCILLWWSKLCGVQWVKHIFWPLSPEPLHSSSHSNCGPGKFVFLSYLHTGMTWLAVYTSLSETLVYTVLVTISQEEDIICLFLTAQHESI